jgi:hypothetical protein
MSRATTITLSAIAVACAVSALSLALCCTGDDSAAPSQNLPEPWYISDCQYFAPDADFKLSREAAAMKAYNADLEAQQRGQ